MIPKTPTLEPRGEGRKGLSPFKVGLTNFEPEFEGISGSGEERFFCSIRSYLSGVVPRGLVFILECVQVVLGGGVVRRKILETYRIE